VRVRSSESVPAGVERMMESRERTPSMRERRAVMGLLGDAEAAAGGAAAAAAATGAESEIAGARDDVRDGNEAVVEADAFSDVAFSEAIFAGNSFDN
jgi:hypothetical protein